MAADISVRVKKWGNSLGITIPKEVAQRERIGVNDEIVVTISRKAPLRDLYGTLREWKVSPQKLKDESRKLWE